MKTLFRSGTIYDGTGGEPFIGDLLFNAIMECYNR